MRGRRRAAQHSRSGHDLLARRRQVLRVRHVHAEADTVLRHVLVQRVVGDEDDGHAAAGVPHHAGEVRACVAHQPCLVHHDEHASAAAAAARIRVQLPLHPQRGLPLAVAHGRRSVAGKGGVDGALVATRCLDQRATLAGSHTTPVVRVRGFVPHRLCRRRRRKGCQRGDHAAAASEPLRHKRVGERLRGTRRACDDEGNAAVQRQHLQQHRLHHPLVQVHVGRHGLRRDVLRAERAHRRRDEGCKAGVPQARSRNVVVVALVVAIAAVKAGVPPHNTVQARSELGSLVTLKPEVVHNSDRQRHGVQYVGPGGRCVLPALVTAAAAATACGRRGGDAHNPQ
eukprot:Rhum_TRINITY_DN14605_c14_g1::Rhum_TRINITY_DN14605_c14_g1_i1::g.103805::m.103805